MGLICRSRLRRRADEHCCACLPRRGSWPSLLAIVARRLGARARRSSDRDSRRGSSRWPSEWTTSPRACRDRRQGAAKTPCAPGSSSRSVRRSIVDEVIARCAEAAVSLPGVAGALGQVELDGVPLAATAGLDSRPAAADAGPPDGGRVRAVGLSYHYAQARARRALSSVGRRDAAREPDGRSRLPDRIRPHRGASGGGDRTFSCWRQSPGTPGRRSRKRPDAGATAPRTTG